MRLISFRDLRNSPAKIRSLLKKGDLTLTARGKPVAVLIPIDEDSIEEVHQALRQARAQLAMTRMRRRAAELGADMLSDAEIDGEIRRARQQRQRPRGRARRQAG